jgi:HEAT repeat protein
MAKGRIPPERPRPKIPGGARRPLQRVNLDGLDAVRLRQRLNVRLLERSCAIDPEPERQFVEAELPLLVQIARARVSGTNPALRRGAVKALGTFQRLEAVEALTRLAASEVEHESFRGEALIALGGASPSLAPSIIRKHIGDPSPVIRQCAALALGRSGSPEAIEVLAELGRGERNAAVLARIAAVAKSLHVTLPGVKTPPKARRGTPAVDRARGSSQRSP